MISSENKIKHVILDDGAEFWFDSDGNLHQDDDIPATIYPNGDEEYCKEGKYYRKFGPSTKRSNGKEYWNTNISRKIISLHRTGGAAVIRPNGERKYLQTRIG